MSLFRPRAATERRDVLSSASIPLNSEGYYNASGRTVTTDSSLRLGAVYACVGLIADALATTPIDVYRKTLDGQRIPLPTPRLLDRPSGDTEMVEWLFSLFASLLLRGNAYGFKDSYDEFGYPREIHLIHPDEVTVQRRSNDNPEPVYRFNGMEVPRRQVFHIKGFTMPGALEGLSPIRCHAQTIGMGLAAEEYGARWFGDSGHPTAVLQTDQQVSQDQATVIKARLMSSIRGRREPIVLGAGLSWQSIQVPPNESMFLDTVRFSVNDIARIFHVPAEKIGGSSEGSSLTYGNREANVIEFQTDALLPNAVRFEQHVSRLLPGKQFVRFNMDAAIRVDLKTRYEAHKIGIDAGFLTVDEARELEDRQPLTAAQLAAQKARQPVAPAAMAPQPGDGTPAARQIEAFEQMRSLAQEMRGDPPVVNVHFDKTGKIVKTIQRDAEGEIATVTEESV